MNVACNFLTIQRKNLLNCDWFDPFVLDFCWAFILFLRDTNSRENALTKYVVTMVQIEHASCRKVSWCCGEGKMILKIHRLVWTGLRAQQISPSGHQAKCCSPRLALFVYLWWGEFGLCL
ncbi:unnamed protein product [Sphacelaria rigidula]